MVENVKLVCVAGPCAGKEYSLDEAEVVIGRAVECTISIPDTSVSRKHVLLRRLPGGWTCADMASGNGTLLNAEPLSEDMPLRNGDRLSLGDTEFTFMDTGNSTDRRAFPIRRSGDKGEVRPRVARAQTKEVAAVRRAKRRRFGIYAGLGVLLCLGIAGGHFWKEQKRAEIFRQRDSEVQRKAAQTAQVFQEGKALVRQNRWMEALPKFEEAKAADPASSSVADYMKASKREIPVERALNQAEGFIGESRLAEAQKRLATVPHDTAQFERLQKLQSALEEKVKTRLAEAARTAEVAEKVSSPSDTSKWAQVLALSQDALLARPDSRDAKALRDRAQSAIAVLSAPKPKALPPPLAKLDPALEISRRFLDGDEKGALETAAACAAKVPRCKTLQEQMSELLSLYEKLDTLDAKGLEQLLDLNNKVTGGVGSKWSALASTKAAGLFYQSASAAKVSGQWARALTYANKALKADPSHGPSLALVAEMRGKTKELYLQAYSVKESNPEEAVRLFKEVIAMSPRDDASHTKAEHWLRTLVR